MLDDTTAPTGLFTDDSHTTRCTWCRATPHYQHYHDNEWGFPVDSDTRLFEKICLEGFQAGLSWLTILNKREAFRLAFTGPTPACDLRHWRHISPVEHCHIPGLV